MAYKSFRPQPALAEQITVNRAGRLTRMQRNSIMIAGLVSAGALLCVGAFLLQGLAALTLGVPLGNAVSILFLVFFLGSFGYLALTAYFNAGWYLPDAFGKEPVAQVRGRLDLKVAERERPEMPYSYIVGDYSFAPFVVPAEIPLEKGREYIVYYAARSRLFLSIEPVDYTGDEAVNEAINEDT